MKAKIIYIGTFIAAFVIVTGAFIFLNSMYTNIFEFDFTPISHTQDSLKVDQKKPESLTKKEEKTKKIEEKKEQNTAENINKVVNEIDSTVSNASNKSVDDEKEKLVVKNEVPKNEQTKQKTDEIKEESKGQIISVKEPDKNPEVISNLVELEAQLTKVDSSYILWTKKTAKMYEAMDADKAAKIIVNYSDNIAKDILYSMKRKKAAEILANINPETASRITRAQNGF